MIDYEKIEARITEEIKNFRQVSQEKMAEDLVMYQADISNLEEEYQIKNNYSIAELSLYKLQLL